MLFDDEELLARFNNRLARIESEIPNPPGMSFRGAGSMTPIGGGRGSRLSWLAPAFVVAISVVVLSVIGLQSLPGPDATPSTPAVGQTSDPSPGSSAPPSATSSEGPTATSTPSSSQTPMPSSAPSPSPTPPPTPSAPPQTPTPGPGGWIGPELIATEHHTELSLVLDRAGYAHVAAVSGGPSFYGDGIFYLTNASGSWTRERLTTAPTDGYDGEPSIVIRDNGSLAIAFGRFGGLACTFGCVPVDPQGIFLTTNRSGSWSDAVRIVEGRVQEPSLQATEDRLHLAYSRGVGPRDEIGDEDRIVEYTYADDEIGTWAIQAVGDGRAPSLRIGRDGLARIAFDQRYRADNLYYAAQAESGEFVVERVPGEWIVYTQPLLALGATDEPQIVFYGEGEESRTLSIRRTGGSWSEASAVFPDYEFCCLGPEDIATDRDGTSHVVSPFVLSGAGVWYSNDAGGEFRARQLRAAMGGVSDIPDGASAIAVDDSGRPHVLYVVSEYDESPRDETGLWYVIGPAE